MTARLAADPAGSHRAPQWRGATDPVFCFRDSRQ
jgi:hypothetical protein